MILSNLSANCIPSFTIWRRFARLAAAASVTRHPLRKSLSLYLRRDCREFICKDIIDTLTWEDYFEDDWVDGNRYYNTSYWNALGCIDYGDYFTTDLDSFIDFLDLYKLILLL